MPSREITRYEYFFKILGNGVLIILLCVFQIGFFSSLPWPVNYLNIVLLVAIILIFLTDYRGALKFAILAGIVLDFFSHLPFGSLSLLMVVTVILSNIMFNNFFTNRSFYSLVLLGFSGNLIYVIGLFFLNLFFYITGFKNNLESFFSEINIFGLMWQVIFTITLSAIIFFIFNYLSKKFKSVFY